MTVERRSKWPQAVELQQAADAKRATGTPEDAAIADWLEATANAMAWLAPFREHEPGYPLWESATAYAQLINRSATR